jgi:hypothetical protein
MGKPLAIVQTLKALASNSNHLRQRFQRSSGFSFCYPGYEPWAETRELLRSSTFNPSIYTFAEFLCKVDHFSVENGDSPLRDVALEVLARAGWLPHP